MKNNSVISTRQKELLRLIISDYITIGEPIGSEVFLTRHKLNFSSATIRNEMAYLEKIGFLEKAHTSSGRIPSLQGFEYYAKNLSTETNENLTKKLEDIFAKRRASIEFTIDEAANAISEIAGFTLSISSKETDELMKSIQLTPINEKMATIVIVTSTGRVESKLLEFNSFVKIDDVRIAVRIFKERLIDTRLKDLALKVEMLAPILAEAIKNYEQVIQAFVGKVFDFHTHIQNKVYGNSNVILASDIKRDDLAKLLNLIEKKSIWESIEGTTQDEENLKIDIRPENVSLISKRINANGEFKEISVIGSHRIDYAEAKQAIILLEKFLKGNKGD